MSIAELKAAFFHSKDIPRVYAVMRRVTDQNLMYKTNFTQRRFANAAM